MSRKAEVGGLQMGGKGGQDPKNETGGVHASSWAETARAEGALAPRF